MSLENNQKGENNAYDPLEDYGYVHGPIGIAILSIFLDRAITLLFWNYEANPVVLELGVFNWIGVTMLLIFGLLYVWYVAMGVDTPIVRGLMWFVTLGHLAAAGMNILAVFA